MLVYGLLFLSHSSGSLGNSGMENNFTYLVISTGEVHTAEIIKKKRAGGAACSPLGRDLVWHAQTLAHLSPSMAVHICNPRTLEAQGHPQLHFEFNLGYMRCFL